MNDSFRSQGNLWHTGFSFLSSLKWFYHYCMPQLNGHIRIYIAERWGNPILKWIITILTRCFSVKQFHNLMGSYLIFLTGKWEIPFWNGSFRFCSFLIAKWESHLFMVFSHGRTEHGKIPFPVGKFISQCPRTSPKFRGLAARLYRRRAALPKVWSAAI